MKKWLKGFSRKTKAIILGLLIVFLSVGGYFIWTNLNKAPSNIDTDIDVNKESMVYRRIYHFQIKV